MTSPILTAARRDLSANLKASLALAAVCAIVLGFNWKYVYNWMAGPFPFDSFEAGIASRASVREFVRAEGPIASTGWAQESTIRLLRGVVESKNTSAQYLAMA